MFCPRQIGMWMPARNPFDAFHVDRYAGHPASSTTRRPRARRADVKCPETYAVIFREPVYVVRRPWNRPWRSTAFRMVGSFARTATPPEQRGHTYALTARKRRTARRSTWKPKGTCSVYRFHV